MEYNCFQCEFESDDIEEAKMHFLNNQQHRGNMPYGHIGNPGVVHEKKFLTKKFKKTGYFFVGLEEYDVTKKRPLWKRLLRR